MQILHIAAYIYVNLQSIPVSLNCTDKEHTVVVWQAIWVLFRLVFTLCASADGIGL